MQKAKKLWNKIRKSREKRSRSLKRSKSREDIYKRAIKADQNSFKRLENQIIINKLNFSTLKSVNN